MIKTPLNIQKVANSKVDQLDFDNIPFEKVFTDHMYVADYKDGKWGDFRIEPFTHIPVHPRSNRATSYLSMRLLLSTPLVGHGVVALCAAKPP